MRRSEPTNRIRLCSTGKVAYLNYHAARQDLWRLRRNPKVRSQATYRCPECGLWHLTSGRNSRRYTVR